MKKTIAELLAAQAAQRDAAAATAKDSAPPAVVVDLTPEQQAEADATKKAADPAASAAEPTFAMTADGRVQVVGTVAADSVLAPLVKADADGKQYLVGVKVPAAPGISELATQLGQETVKRAGAEAQVTELEAQVAAMAAIVTGSVNTMTIAMGGGAVDTSKLDVDSLLAAHAAAEASYKTKFPVGGVAATNSDDESAAAAKATKEDATFSRRVSLVKPRGVNQ